MKGKSFREVFLRTKAIRLGDIDGDGRQPLLSKEFRD
jgi:hypothetical protein